MERILNRLGDWLGQKSFNLTFGIAMAIFLLGALQSLVVRNRFLICVFALLSALLGVLVFLAYVSAVVLAWKGRFIIRTILSVEMIQGLNWKDFERLIAAILRADGYTIEVRGGEKPDGGIDMIAEKGGKRYIVQCKSYWKQDIEVSLIRELYGVVCAEKADGGMFFTCTGFTAPARQFAENLPLQLFSAEEIYEKIRKIQEARAEETSSPEAAERFFESIVQKVAETSENQIPRCPICHSSMIFRATSVGGGFWGCSNYYTSGCTGKRQPNKREEHILKRILEKFGKGR